MNYDGQTSLFLSRERDLTKVATAKLGQNPKEWESDILGLLHQQHPYLVNSKLNINIKNSDPESGSGIGAITLDNKITIPIIIKNFRLEPLDVFFNNNQIIPLTRSRIEQTLKTLAIGTPVKPAKGEATDSSITYMTAPPHDGKYTFASNLAFSRQEFSDAVSRSFSQEGLSFEIANNGLWKEALLGYLDNTKEITKTASAPTYSIKDYTPPTVKETDGPGVYSVVTENGVRTGILAPFTEKTARKNEWLFASLDTGEYAIFDAKPKLPCVDDRAIKLASRDTNSWGTYVYMGKDGLQVTDELLPIYKTASHTAVKDRLGKEHLAFFIKEADKIEAEGNILVIPENALFIPLETKIHIPTVKIASILEAGPNVITVTHRNHRYYLQGVDTWEFADGLSKEGSYIEDLQEHLAGYFDDQAINKMVNVPNNSEANFIIVKAAKEVENPVAVPVLTTEQLAAITKTASIIDDVSSDFIKISQAVGADTVDSLLGLNFLNKQNITKFLDNMDKIADARQVVGQLLLASRIGLDVDQAPIRTAIFALDEIEQDLHQLYNVTNSQE